MHVGAGEVHEGGLLLLGSSEEKMSQFRPFTERGTAGKWEIVNSKYSNTLCLLLPFTSQLKEASFKIKKIKKTPPPSQSEDADGRCVDNVGRRYFLQRQGLPTSFPASARPQLIGPPAGHVLTRG